MFCSAEKVSKNSVIQTEICIVGSGPAGLALAREFLDTNRRVCILESDSPALNDVEAPALPVSNDSRARGFGGTTKVWLGIWKTLDPDDFEPKSYMANSGWPIGFSDLRGYYERSVYKFSAPHPVDFATSSDFFGSQLIAPTAFFRLEKPDLDLGEKFRQLFAVSQNVGVYLGANVTKLQSEGAQIQTAAIRTLSGNAFSVQAKIFVLAAGGIENPRLLLLSNLGNDNVGRYYMDHPKGLAGTIQAPGRKLKAFYFSAQDRWVGLVLTPEARREKQLLNSHILLEPVRTRILRRVIAVRIRNFMEQIPSAQNRVTLSEQKDALGLPKARVTWQLHEPEQRTMIEFHKILKSELVRLSLGNLASPLLEAGGQFPISKDASHHMGTTRMGIDRATSVVDANCKVHDLDNLYVAGSSVFPTAGYANPTATIVALAIRLADHLKNV